MAYEIRPFDIFVVVSTTTYDNPRARVFASLASAQRWYVNHVAWECNAQGDDATSQELKQHLNAASTAEEYAKVVDYAASVWEQVAPDGHWLNIERERMNP